MFRTYANIASIISPHAIGIETRRFLNIQFS